MGGVNSESKKRLLRRLIQHQGMIYMYYLKLNWQKLKLNFLENYGKIDGWGSAIWIQFIEGEVL